MSGQTCEEQSERGEVELRDVSWNGKASLKHIGQHQASSKC